MWSSGVFSFLRACPGDGVLYILLAQFFTNCICVHNSINNSRTWGCNKFCLVVHSLIPMKENCTFSSCYCWFLFYLTIDTGLLIFSCWDHFEIQFSTWRFWLWSLVTAWWEFLQKLWLVLYDHHSEERSWINSPPSSSYRGQSIGRSFPLQNRPSSIVEVHYWLISTQTVIFMQMNIQTLGKTFSWRKWEGL